MVPCDGRMAAVEIGPFGTGTARPVGVSLKV